MGLERLHSVESRLAGATCSDRCSVPLVEEDLCGGDPQRGRETRWGQLMNRQQTTSAGLRDPGAAPRSTEHGWTLK